MDPYILDLSLINICLEFERRSTQMVLCYFYRFKSLLMKSVKKAI